MTSNLETSPLELARIEQRGRSDEIAAAVMRGEIQARLFGDAPSPVRIDRFVIARRLGAGGMGVVYAAYDPVLDRRVAIKLVRARSGESDGSRYQERLLREARALARLSHPNVIAVFEAGTHAGDVFIAMELVDGVTLDAFAKAPGRSRRAIVEAYLDAASGLAAAHEAGLVHRDFKPQNVLVGHDARGARAFGRVRVLDFGLARIGDRDSDDDAARSADTERPQAATLTDPDSVLGTPAYMAPEQRLGEPVGPAANQFAFCASLHEALCGSVPRVVAGQRTIVLARRGLTRRVRRALVRGLAFEPEARWPSMDALARELRRELGRRGLVLAGIAGAGIAATSLVVLLHDDPCPDASPQLQGVWDVDRSTAVAASVRWDDSEAAIEASQLTVRHLDAFAREWTEAHHRACEAHHVEHAESAALFDRKMTCLARRRDAIAALGDALLEADREGARKAVEAALKLPPVSECEDSERVLADVAPPEDPETAEAVERVRVTLERERVLANLGELEDALVLAREAAAAADETGHRPVQAEATYAVARVLVLSSDSEVATVLRQALWYAEAGRQDEVAARCLTDLVGAEADREEFERAREAATMARAAIERVGRQWPFEAFLEGGLATLAAREARFAEGRDHARRAFELAHEHAPGSLTEGQAANNLGLAFYRLGDYDDAREWFAKALEIQRASLGELHPHFINTTTNLAGTDERRGDADAAERGLLQAVAAAERADLPLQESRASTNLANLRRAQGRPQDALAPAERGVDLIATKFGRDDLEILAARNSLGAIYSSLGRTGDERAEYEEVIRIARSREGQNKSLALALHNLADCDLQAGDPKQAEERVTEAIRLVSEELGPDHPDVAAFGVVLVLALLEQGRLDDALREAQQSVAVLRRAGGSNPELPRAEFTLAKVLAARGEPDAARAAAGAALTSGIPHAQREAEIREWMRALDETRDRNGTSDVSPSK